MKINPYLGFNGQCEAAFKFYEKCLGGKITFIMKYRDSPMADKTRPDWRQKVMHASLAVRDQILQGADAPPDRYEKPQGIFVSLNIDDPAEADRTFAALADKGAIQMPIQQTFWAQRFGMLVDQFGTPWMINCPSHLRAP